jgi:hypothetical protein
MKTKPFYEKLYFIDFVHDTWAGLIATSGGARPDRPNLDSNDKLKHEYLRHVLKKDEVYSVPQTKTEVQEDGTNLTTTEDVYFQVLGVEHGSNRPKLLTTFMDSSDPAYNYSAGVMLHYMTKHSEPRPGCIVAYIDSDPCNINIMDLGLFDDMRTLLKKWVVGASTIMGCMELSASTRAVPVAAITDRDCPVIMILQALRRRGWNPVTEHIVHNNAAIGNFDYRDVHTKRFYLQCLYSLADVVKTNPSVDSHQPQSYFLLLQKGVVVEA